MKTHKNTAPIDHYRSSWLPLLICALALVAGISTAQAADPFAVATFQSIGLRWKPDNGGAKDNICNLRFRKAGDETWREGLPLFFDDTFHLTAPERRDEYRGSIVQLQPGTLYEIHLRLADDSAEATLQISTWSEERTIAREIQLDPASPQPIHITEGGSPQDGYVLYTAPEGTVFDGQNTAESNLVVSASHVILRGLTLTNASTHGIVLNAVQDVIIENCDISEWGRIAANGYGVNLDSAIYSGSPELERIILQDNHLHHPRSNANSWLEEREHEGKMSFHPIGPQGITFRESAGNHVIRRNRIESSPDRKFNDGMGALGNFSYQGFPGPDSDIYDNHISQVWDEGIEAEGGGLNVRIWGNYIDDTYGAIAAASVSLGPQYIFRNVLARSRKGPSYDFAGTQGYFLIKLGTEGSRWTKGKIYIFHNTMLQPDPWPGSFFPSSGGNLGILTTGDSKYQSNVTSRNNILNMRSPDRNAIKDHQRDPTNSFDYDLYYGQIDVAPGNQSHGIFGRPIFDTSVPGRFPLTPESPGFDAGERIPNFNDDYTGEGPDIGAFENPLGSLNPALPPWAGYERLPSGWADTGDFLGWVFPSKDWVFLQKIERFIYLPEHHLASTGAWAYIPR